MKYGIATLTCLMLILLVSRFLSLGHGEAGAQELDTDVRFEVVDVYIDSGDQPLAVYQFELIEKTGHAKIVGVEGGEHDAFKDPPYYDPAALMNQRIIIANFNMATELPVGKTRVARLHFQVSAMEKSEYEISLVVAASGEGEKIAGATISVSEGSVSEGKSK